MTILLYFASIVREYSRCNVDSRVGGRNPIPMKCEILDSRSFP